MTDLDTLRRHEASLDVLATNAAKNLDYMRVFPGTADADIDWYVHEVEAMAWALKRCREDIAAAERCPRCSGHGYDVERQGCPPCESCNGARQEQRR